MIHRSRTLINRTPEYLNRQSVHEEKLLLEKKKKKRGIEIDRERERERDREREREREIESLI